MTPNLSSFYQHALDYSQYVALAYGISGCVLGGLIALVLYKYRSNRVLLKRLEEEGQ